MELKFNNDKLKLKYIIGNYRDLESYPTCEDIAYDLILWAISNNKKEVKVSDAFILKMLNKSLEDISSKLFSLEESGVIKSTTKNEKITYTLTKNIFI